jgi:ubiquinone/menaquinone biosynthesis C-methylase UbiE
MIPAARRNDAGLARRAMPPFNHFDILAPFYDRLIRPMEETPLVQLMNLPLGGDLLDLGGGTGRASAAFTEQAARVVVADASQNMLAQSAQKDGLMAVATLGESLSLASDAFAGVIIVDALHHMADQAGSLREMWRVLAPGGRLIVEEPDIQYLSVKIVATLEKLALMGSRFIPAEDVAAILESCGAQTHIVRESYTFWVVADKPERGEIDPS